MSITDFLARTTGTRQVLEVAKECRSLEEFLEACFSESGRDICVVPPAIASLAPDLCRLVRGRAIRDRSHYDGYLNDPEQPPLRDASLVLNGDRLFLNYRDLKCSLGDPALHSLRIQLQIRQYRDGDKIRVALPEVTFYFDFWDEEKGFSRKCVILHIRLEPAKLGTLESQLGRQKHREPREALQDSRAAQPTRASNVASDRGQLGLFWNPSKILFERDVRARANDRK